MSLSPYTLDDPEVSAAVIPRVMEELTQKGTALFETVHVARDGTRIPVENHTRRFVLSGWEMLLTISRDIRQRKMDEARLHRVNRALKVLSACGRAVVESTEEAELLDRICLHLVEIGGYSLAWIGEIGTEPEKPVRPVIGKGRKGEYLKKIDVSWGDDEKGQGPTGTAIRTGRPVVCKDMSTDPAFAPWREEAIASGFHSSISIPLLTGGNVLACLCIYSDESNSFDREEVGLLTELGDNLAYGIVSIRNRIQRRKAETELQESEERYRVAVEYSHDGFVFAEDERVLFCNRRFLEIFGYEDADEVIGKPITMMIHPDDSEWVLDIYRRWERGEIVPRRYEIKGLRKDGTTVDIEVTSAQTRYQQRDVNVAFLRDVTERKQMEAELFQARKLESIGVLAGGIAHDFNNLLTVILGNLTLLQDEIDADGDGGASGFLREMERAAGRAGELARQLITFSSGGAPVKRTGSIQDILRNTAESVFAGSPVQCEVFAGPDVWDTAFDERQVQQALENILMNALEAMPEGGRVTLRVENIWIYRADMDGRFPLEEGQYIKISVQDRGAGIPDENLSRIFDPYFSTKQRGTQKGMGMGLATAFSIIKKHDGHITVTSRAGEGSTFVIYLPVTDKTVPVLDQPVTSDRTSRGKKILVMDDEEMVRHLLSKMLQRLGYEVVLTAEGNEAVAAYRNAMQSDAPVDLAILDLTIQGGMGGKETIRKLLEIDPQVRAVISSGYSNDPVMADYRSYGFSGVMVKPYRKVELQEILRNMLNGS